MFSSLQLHPRLGRAIADLGFIKPTPIQQEAIPPAMTGRDVLACAQTGSGKTAAFLLPILHQLVDATRGTTRVLVLTPTRELAAQILADFNDLARHTTVKAAAVFGGVAMGPQQQAFKRGVDVLIATPGRLLDHFQYPYAKIAGLEYLVLDEADRMLDMGFLPDIRRVLRHLPTPRQTLFFSATMPEPIAKLTREMLKNPVSINIGRQSTPPPSITQAVYPVAQELKAHLLLAILNQNVVNEVLVFTRTKHRANRLQAFLAKHGVNAERIHGGRSQPQRTQALAGFKSGKYRVLVATDIAARGIDIEALGHVINFDVPAVPDDYIHRVGRTARAEMAGDAFTFVSPQENGDLMGIERAVGRKLTRVIVDGFDYSAKPEAKLEVPLAERIAGIRARKKVERERAKLNAEHRGTRSGPAMHPPANPQAGRRHSNRRRTG